MKLLKYLLLVVLLIPLAYATLTITPANPSAYSTSTANNVMFNFTFVASGVTLNAGNNASCFVHAGNTSLGGLGGNYSKIYEFGNVTNNTYRNASYDFMEGRSYWFINCTAGGTAYSSSKNVFDLDIDYMTLSLGDSAVINFTLDTGNIIAKNNVTAGSNLCIGLDCVTDWTSVNDTGTFVRHQGLIDNITELKNTTILRNNNLTDIFNFGYNGTYVLHQGLLDNVTELKNSTILRWNNFTDIFNFIYNGSFVLHAGLEANITALNLAINNNASMLQTSINQNITALQNSTIIRNNNASDWLLGNQYYGGNCSVSGSCDLVTYDTEFQNSTIVRSNNITEFLKNDTNIRSGFLNVTKIFSFIQSIGNILLYSDNAGTLYTNASAIVLNDNLTRINETGMWFNNSKMYARTADVVVCSSGKEVGVRIKNTQCDIVCDDTDCSNEIQAALNNSMQGKSMLSVYIAEGKYNISNTLYVYSNTSLSGSGTERTTLIKTFTGVNSYFLDARGEHDILVEGITFDLNGNLGDVRFGVIGTRYNKNLVIRNNIFRNSSGFLVTISGDPEVRNHFVSFLDNIVDATGFGSTSDTSTFVLENGRVEGNLFVGGNSSWLTSIYESNHSTMSKNYFKGVNGTRSALVVASCNFCIISENTFSNFAKEYTGDVITVTKESDNGNANNASYNLLSNNMIETSGYSGIRISSSTNKAHHTTISGGIIKLSDTANRNGILIEATNGTIVNGVDIRDASYGILEGVGVGGNIFIDNKFEDISVAKTFIRLGDSYSNHYEYGALSPCTTSSVFDTKTVLNSTGTSYSLCTCVDSTWKCSTLT